MKKILATLAAILSLAHSAFADSSAMPPAAPPMDIMEAIDLTLDNNLTLKSLRQEAEKAAAFKLQADAVWTPAVGLNAYVDKQREPQTSDGSDRDSSRVARATLTQTLYSGGRNSALRRQAQQVRTIADLRLVDGENAAVGELFARFYNVLLHEDQIGTARSAVNTSEAHLREVGKMSELGLANRLEVIRAEQQLATNRADLSAAEGQYDTVLISLMNYMGMPPEARRPVKGSLSVLGVGGDRAASLAAAMENRADRKMLEQQTAYQENQIEIERSGTRPTVSLGASAGYLDPYRGRDSGDDTWRAELSVTVPIFDRNVTRANVLRAQAVLEQDKISLEQKDLDIRSGVETAWTEVETTVEHLESTSQALELAEETLRLAEVGFQEGVTPQLDLLAAQTSLTDARLALLRSRYNYMLAVVALKVTEGNIIEWTGEMVF